MIRFASSYDPQALKNADGALLIIKWSDIEKTPGLFKWDAIDNHQKKCKDAKWSLAVSAGPNTPEFYKTGTCVEFTHRGYAKKMPVFWDQTFLDAMSAMLTAVAERYAGDNTLEVVYAPQSSQNGVEGLLPFALTKGSWTDVGYTAALHANAALSVVDMLYKLFPTHRTALELHESFKTCDAQKMMIDGLKIRQYGGVAVWWNGQGTYQFALQEIIRASGLPVYCQNIAAYKKQPTRFCDYDGNPVDKTWAEQMATDLGAAYIEHWPADLK